MPQNRGLQQQPANALWTRLTLLAKGAHLGQSWRSNATLDLREFITGVGGSEAIDAYLAMKIAVRKLNPSHPQLQAGDINGNGRVDVADATMILYHVVHNEWPLVPPGHNSDQVQADGPVTLTLDDITGVPGTIVHTTLRAENLSNWAGGKFTIIYDTSMVEKITAVTATGLSSGFTAEFNDDGAGQVQFALANDTSITGSGPLATISIKLAANATMGDKTILRLAEADLNDLSGRDFATSALQETIRRTDGQLEIGDNTGQPAKHFIFLPLIIRE